MTDRVETDPVLGRGRSGLVFLRTTDDGREIAVKRFDSRSITRLVQYIFLGVPNPYMWNEHALECAFFRRRIVGLLVRCWFPKKLYVADAVARSWNEEAQAFELATQYVSGRHLPLHHPRRLRRDKRLTELWREIMRPLQVRLRESGFDGLVWQAGYGNPVALNNFLMCQSESDGQPHWAWIDLESGIPALFPANPMKLARFYLPKSLSYRSPLFDDVDITRCRQYVEREQSTIVETVGADAYDRLVKDIDALETNQQRWKSIGRTRNNIRYNRYRGRITDEQAAWYEQHTILWTIRLLLVSIPVAAKSLMRLVMRLIRLLAAFPYVAMSRRLIQFLISYQYRHQLAKLYVSTRIASWTRRGQLSDDDAAWISNLLETEQGGEYITDFGVHLALKPIVKLFQWWILPMLVVAGVIHVKVLAVTLVIGGAAVRTLYTAGRIIQSALTGREQPWMAFFVGLTPVAGNLAYPIQIIDSGTLHDQKLAQFLIYDTLTLSGQTLPIWGGPDTLTEHLFNRIGDIFVRDHDVEHHLEVNPERVSRQDAESQSKENI